MVTANTNILSTKILSPSSLQALECSGLNVTYVDFISIRLSSLPEIGINLDGAIIITSKNAIKAFIASNKIHLLKDTVIYCIGNSSKSILKKHGFTVEKTFFDAADAGKYFSHESIKHLTILCGNRSRKELFLALDNCLIKYKKIITYYTSLTPEVIKGNFKAILFFSPSGIQSYTSRNTLKDEIIICIGRTTALEGEKHSKNILIADDQSIESVVQKTIDLFNKK